MMPLNPPRKPTKQEQVRSLVSQTVDRTERGMYRRSPIIAAFLFGLILGYAFGGVW